VEPFTLGRTARWTPPGAPILNVGNAFYILWADIYDSIVVERDNIVLDGAGYTVQGTGARAGINLTSRSNVVVKNTKVTGFQWGIILHHSGNCTVSGNNATNNRFGINLWHSSNNSIYHNNFIDNTYQVDNRESINTWDDGYPSGGNYWGDYTGKDRNRDGIGDKPRVIDGNNTDKYPLMSPWSPTWSPKTPVEASFWTRWWFWAIVVAGILGLAGAVYFSKKRKPPTLTTPPPPPGGFLFTSRGSSETPSATVPSASRPPAPPPSRCPARTRPVQGCTAPAWAW